MHAVLEEKITEVTEQQIFALHDDEDIFIYHDTTCKICGKRLTIETAILSPGGDLYCWNEWHKNLIPNPQREML